MRKVIKPEEHLEQKAQRSASPVGQKETFHMTEAADCFIKHVSSLSWWRSAVPLHRQEVGSLMMVRDEGALVLVM